MAGPINTFRTVDKVTLDDVVGDHEEDEDFSSIDVKTTSESTESIKSAEDPAKAVEK